MSAVGAGLPVKYTPLWLIILGRCPGMSLSSHSDDSDLIIFEPDDIVLEYSLHSSPDDACVYWYVKQEDRNMLD
ncbi:hypothetical protein ACOMHN_025842 [Nucella lapillus]